MSQYFNVIRIAASMDMGVGNRTREWTYVNADDIAPGDEYQAFGHPLTIRSIDQKEMTFTYIGHTFVLNREWQVVGTPEINIPNKYIHETERFIFYLSSEPNSDYQWEDSGLEEIYSEMMTNMEEGNLWKNIPLARKFIHLLKDSAPFRCGKINPAYKAYLLSLVLKNDLLQKKETPRLFQSYCELYRLCIDYDCTADYDDELEKVFDKTYFRKVDGWIYNYAWIVDNPLSSLAIECWNDLGGMLKTDPVQATPEWEEVIYEVEQEVEAELKDQQRGMGFCFAYWSAKRAALSRRGIEWRSPSAMNPRVMFD